MTHVRNLLPLLLLAVLLSRSSRASQTNDEGTTIVTCVDKQLPEFFERFDTHQLIPSEIRYCIVTANPTHPLYSQEIPLTTPMSLTKDLFPGVTNETESDITVAIQCRVSTRIYFTNLSEAPDLSVKIGFLEMQNCLIDWHDIDIFGRVVDLRVVNLYNKPHSFDEEIHLGFFNTSSEHLNTLPKGLRNIGTLSLIAPVATEQIILASLLSDYEWPVMAEIEIWNYHIPFDLELLQSSMPKLQSIQLGGCNITSPLGRFPWDDNPMALPRNIARTENGNLHYQLATTVPRNMYRRFADYTRSNLTDLSTRRFNGKLHQLKLSSNDIETIGADTFRELETQVLDLSSNRIKNIPTGTFNDLTELTSLDLHNNALEHIAKGVFVNNPNLRVLNMSHNAIESLENDAFVELTRLMILDLSHNHIASLPRSLLSISRGIRLQEVRFTANRISVIPEWCFLLRSVHTFDFSDNLISWPSFKETLNGIDEHKYRFQNIETASEYSSIKSQSCYKPSGRIKRLTLHRQKNFRNINLDEMSERESTMFKEMLFCYELDFDGSSLDCDCNIYSFYLYLHNISDSTQDKHPITLPFMRTQFKCNQPEELHAVPLANVDPSDLRCAQNLSDCPKECTCYSRVIDDKVVVDCENRNLTELPLLLPANSDTLLASGNRITELEYGQREYIKRLNILDLSRNKIAHIQHEFPNFVSSIENLNLRDNRLGCLPKQVSVFTNTTLTLGGNPWMCDCTTEWMKDWIIVRRQYIDIDAMICATGEGQGQRFLDVPRKLFICIQSVNAVLQVSLITVSVFAVCLMIVIVLMYKYRGEIKVLLFVHFNWHPFDRSEEADVLDKDYDVFISYSGYDFSSVVNNLLKYLETLNPPYKTCLHDRDFMVGAAIQDNIMESVRRSRRMVMVLTKNYLESDWCMLEFRAAHDRVLKDHTNYLILVLADDIPIDELEEDIQLYIRTNTYLALGNKWFFDKLRYVLPQVPLCNLKSDLDMTPKLVLSTHDHGIPADCKV